MSEPSDRDLMRAYVQQGDRRAFEAIFKRYGGRLHGFFLRAVANDSEARDLVQQTFLHFHRARRDFDLSKEVRPWLYTIAINVRREFFRRRRRKPEAQLDAEIHPEPTSSPRTSTALDRLVRRCLDELPDSQREVILLHWYDELSFPEISELVGSSVSAVKVRAHRGYNKLRDMLGDPAS